MKNNTNGNNTGEKVTVSSASNSKPESSTSNGQNNPTTSAYTLYLEHLGGFLPLLKGKRMSKIRPEFIIYDPQLQGISYNSYSKTLENEISRQIPTK